MRTLGLQQKGIQVFMSLNSDAFSKRLFSSAVSVNGLADFLQF
jgi:hypothetical protein